MEVKKNSFKMILFMAIVTVLFVSCAPETEIKPPETNIAKIQTVYGTAGVDIVLNGTDEKTPSEKLTYEYHIYRKNAEELELKLSEKSRESLISYRSEIFDEGSYLIKAYAINEFGIKDKSPAEAMFKVDLTPPDNPVIEYLLKNGKVHFSCVEEEDSDTVGYEMKIFDSDEAKAFSTTEEDFVFAAEKGERYILKILAIDLAGNTSEEKEFVIDADVDDSPVIDSDLPVLLGRNDKKIDFIIHDDWSSNGMITRNATFSGIPLKMGDETLNFDLSTISEGTHTLFISLVDENGHDTQIKNDIYVDLTPPYAPHNGDLKENDKMYNISWESISDEETTFRVYGFNVMDNRVYLDETDVPSYKTDERYLHYVISAVDKAGNESSTSYPIRTYNEKYVPITSSKIGVVEENTLLTSLYSPYRINAEIVIPDGLMLGIEKGVEIIFENEGKLKVNGQVLSIPSNSDKKRIISTEFSEGHQRVENVIDIDGGSVWLNAFEIIGDAQTDLFDISNGGELRAQGVLLEGFNTFIKSIDGDIIFMDNSKIRTTIFATGTDCVDVKLNNIHIIADAGISVLNIKNLGIDHCQIESDSIAVNLDGFSNAMLSHSELSADKALVMNKLSAADMIDVNLRGISNALTLNGASAINLRNSTLSASDTAIYVDRSAYLCAIESTITNSGTGIFTMNSDIVLKEVDITENSTGISSSIESFEKPELVSFNANETDLASTEDR